MYHIRSNLRLYRYAKGTIWFLCTLLLLGCLVVFISNLRFFFVPAYEHIGKPSDYLNDQQMNATLKPLIRPAQVCNKTTNFKDNLEKYVMVFVISQMNSQDRRSAIRQTWAQEARENHASVQFLIGVANSPENLKDLRKEQEEYKDLLVYDFQDDYFSLVYKTIAALRFTYDHCPEALYILKVDDDVLLNWKLLMQTLTQYAPQAAKHPFFLGKVSSNLKPHRQPRSRWYIDHDSYALDEFPHFVCGPMYILSGPAVKQLIPLLKMHKPITLEDVYVTGILRSDLKNQTLVHLDNHLRDLVINTCRLRNFHALHMVNPSDMQSLWPYFCDGSEQAIQNGSVSCSIWKEMFGKIIY